MAHVSSSVAQEWGADWALAELQKGDQRAWRLAFADLWPVALQQIRTQVFSAEAAEDLAQETLAFVASAANSWRSRGHIKHVTRLVARRKAAHFLRDQTAGKRDRRLEVGLDEASVLAAEIDAAWSLARFEESLATLPPDDRALLTDHFVHDLSSQEIGAARGLNPNTVRSRLKRALEQLRDSSALLGAVHAGLLLALALLASYAALVGLP